MVQRNPETHADMKAFLPNAEGHFATAFAVDDEWWQLHGPDIEPRWQMWLAGQ
jgi:hypothetical protein